MNIDNQNSHDDPQFVKVLETCLKMEIATAQEKLDVNMAEINRLKIMIRNELDRRKRLKEKVAQMKRIKIILSETLTKLHISINEILDNLEVVKANADDQYKLIQLQSQEYQDIVAKYKKTWQSYHAMYKEFPLAKAKNAAKINLEKVKIEYMVINYKKLEIMTIIKQRQRINWIRIRCKIIEFATVMVERLKWEKQLTKLKMNVDYHRRELQSIETELQVMRKKEEDQKRLRKQKMLEMAPPKINIPYRKMYGQRQVCTKEQHQWRQLNENFDDTISVNTLILEELCINDNTTVSSVIDVETVQSNDCKRTAIQTGKSNIENVVSKETDTSVASAVTPEVEASVEEATLTDNDVKMKETHQEKIQSQESVKTQVSSRINENPLKHSAAKNIQDEIEAKRIRLQRENSRGNSNEITTPQPSTVTKEANLKSPLLSLPRITKIETVRYIVPKHVHHPSVTASSMFSPTHYEHCDSNISSLDQDFMSKGPSLYEGSLCNYKLSPISNITSMYVEENAQMVSSPKYTLQKDNKNQSDDKILSFQFTDYMKKTKDDFTSLF